MPRTHKIAKHLGVAVPDASMSNEPRLTHMIHKLQNAENLHHKAAEKGTRTVREWIGQIIMCE